PHPHQRAARAVSGMTLVVTADDLGLSPGVTKGILESHRRGVVRSASLVVTFAAAEEAAALAPAEHDLEVGLHLDLVRGRPIAAREEGVRWVRRGTAPRWPGAKGAAIHAASLVSALAYRGIAGNAWYVDLTGSRPRLDATGLALLPAYGRLGEIGAHPGYVDA